MNGWANVYEIIWQSSWVSEFGFLISLTGSKFVHLMLFGGTSVIFRFGNWVRIWLSVISCVISVCPVCCHKSKSLGYIGGAWPEASVTESLLIGRLNSATTVNWRISLNPSLQNHTIVNQTWNLNKREIIIEHHKSARGKFIQLFYNPLNNIFLFITFYGITPTYIAL